MLAALSTYTRGEIMAGISVESMLDDARIRIETTIISPEEQEDKESYYNKVKNDLYWIDIKNDKNIKFNYDYDRDIEYKHIYPLTLNQINQIYQKRLDELKYKIEKKRKEKDEEFKVQLKKYHSKIKRLHILKTNGKITKVMIKEYLRSMGYRMSGISNAGNIKKMTDMILNKFDAKEEDIIHSHYINQIEETKNSLVSHIDDTMRKIKRDMNKVITFIKSLPKRKRTIMRRKRILIIKK